MRSFIIALTLGGALGFLLPSSAVLSGSAELIAFVSLIMAGLLPAMILTATAIRGDAFSTARVREYGEGLRRQLQFWAVLFLVALVAVLSICVAKIANNTGSIAFGETPDHMMADAFVRASLTAGLAALSVVIARLYPAYVGLRSLLDLTIRMAEAQALANDRSFSDALDAKAARIGATSVPSPKVDWPS